MNKRTIRDVLKLIGSIFFFWLYIPHLIIYFIFSDIRKNVNSDLTAIRQQLNFSIPLGLQLLYQLHTNQYFRNVFYYRIGPVFDLIIGWYRPGDKYFWLPFSTKIGKGLYYAHPYSTILNAESIGENFSCLHCTTIGKRGPGERRPRIGDNVTVGCHVAIIGDIVIGNNVIIGAGSVVVKDIPDNVVVVGNPARIIKTLASVD